MDKMQQIFRTEAEELIGVLEVTLLEFEKDLTSPSAVQEIFRVMHTLKGSASMFGFETLSALTHDLENIYDDIRSGRHSVTEDIVEVTLECVDHIKKILGDPHLADHGLRKVHEYLVGRIRSLVFVSSEPVRSVTTGHEKTLVTYYISFKPGVDIFRNGTNPLFLIDDLANLGASWVVPNLSSMPALEEMESGHCYTSFEIILATDEPQNTVSEVFIFVEDACKIEIKKLADGNALANPAFADALKNGSLSFPVPAALGFDFFNKLIHQSSPSLLNNIKAVQEKKETSTIRVSSDKLDELMNLVSELVTSQARLSLLSEQYGLSDLVNVTENMDKLTRRLRDNAFNICLVPIESIVIRFQRLVRDLAKELHKEIDFVTDGTETELDRSIIEKITDPILHILRNCIDHGIETPDERKSAGKGGKGTILFKAFHSGTNVVIQISDNGRGIDPAKIRSKAIEKGLITQESQLTTKEALNFIFSAGFSTAEKITDVSGRGVGMDIVRRNIESIHGEVSVDSELGLGTTITIKLPLTLSILDGMLIQVGESKYVLPLSSIQTCYEIDSKKLSDDVAQKHAFDGELLPVFNLHAAFESRAARHQISQVIKLHYDEFPVGISIDGVIGEYQAVMKPLGDLYKGHDEFSGATILGDGSVALVLDTTTLVRQLIQKESKN